MRQVEVTLAGGNGIQTTSVRTRGGFPTRHIRTRPVAKSVVNPEAKPRTDFTTLLAEVDALLGNR